MQEYITNATPTRSCQSYARCTSDVPVRVYLAALGGHAPRRNLEPGMQQQYDAGYSAGKAIRADAKAMGFDLKE
jgi:hypothetical protein